MVEPGRTCRGFNGCPSTCTQRLIKGASGGLWGVLGAREGGSPACLLKMDVPRPQLLRTHGWSPHGSPAAVIVFYCSETHSESAMVSETQLSRLVLFIFRLSEQKNKLDTV